jgi:hypothetical protein
MEQSLRLRSAMRSPFPSTRFASCYVCFQCRHRASTIAPRARIFPPVRTSVRPYASSGGRENSFSERFRRRLWKTEPPGQKDPYSFEERDALRAAAEAKPAARENAVEEIGSPTASIPASESEPYVPATTWDGLEQIGGPTGWWEEAWDQVNRFEGSVVTPGAFVVRVCDR